MKTGKTIVYHADDGWRWRAKSPNGKIVSESGEAYARPGRAEQAARDFSPPNFDILTERPDGAGNTRRHKIYAALEIRLDLRRALLHTPKIR